MLSCLHKSIDNRHKQGYNRIKSQEKRIYGVARDNDIGRILRSDARYKAYGNKDSQER